MTAAGLPTLLPDSLLGAAVGVLGSAGMGLLSALVPFVNAELYAVALSTQAGPVLAVLCAVALAVGQTGGKWLWYVTGRAGSARLSRRRLLHSRTAGQGSSGHGSSGHGSSGHVPGGHGPAVDPGRVARLGARLRDRRSSAAVVLLSGSIGLPPLAVVAVAAGATRMRLADFLLCCLLGRTLRFCAVLLPLALR